MSGEYWKPCTVRQETIAHTHTHTHTHAHSSSGGYSHSGEVPLLHLYSRHLRVCRNSHWKYRLYPLKVGFFPPPFTLTLILLPPSISPSHTHSIKLSGLEIPTSSLTSGGKGLVVKASGISLHVSADWHYREHSW